jgi:hypothetical protein
MSRSITPQPPTFPNLQEWLAMTSVQRDAAEMRYYRQCREFGEASWKQVLMLYGITG